MINQDQVVLISAGGTGGHMSPAASLAANLRARGLSIILVTDPRGQKYISMFPSETPVYVIQAGTLGSGIMGKIKGLINLTIGLFKARNLVSKLKPSLIVGFGGYPSVPAVWAGQAKKIPTIIHEQNAIIGKANSFLAPRAARIALSIPESRGLDKAETLRAVVTGNPVRPEIVALHSQGYDVPRPSGELRILVMGGSLGATVFSDVVPQTLAQLTSEYRKRLNIVQQCRQSDIEKVRDIYEQTGIKAELATFYNDIADKLAWAHLVIARSGASTVAEVTSAGRPSIFVPYPHHKDQQQKMNADAVADGGGAWVMTESGFTQEALLARIETFLQSPETLARAAQNAHAFGKPEAAQKLGDLVLAVIAGNVKKGI